MYPDNVWVVLLLHIRNIQLLIFVLFLFLPIVSSSADFAYVVNAQGSSVSAYRVQPSGLLDYAGHWPVHNNPTAAAVHPNGKFLYVTSKVTDRISVFGIEAQTGRLKEIQGSPFQVQGRSLFNLYFHPSGNYLYAAGRFSGISAMKVNDATGMVEDIKGSPFKAQERTRSLVLTANGKYLYASNAYSNSVSAYHIDQSNGQLRQLKASPYNGGHSSPIGKQGLPLIDMPIKGGGVPYNVVLHPAGKFLLVTNWAGASVSVFRLDQNSGQLSLVPGAPFPVDLNPYTVAVHPGGKIVYVGSWSGHSIQVFSFDQNTGTLSWQKSLDVSAQGQAPIRFEFTADGDYLYVVNNWSNSIVRFQVQANGGLLKDARMQTRSGPHDLVFLRQSRGKHLKSQDILLLRKDSGQMAVVKSGGVKQKNSIVAVAENLKAKQVTVHGRMGRVFAYDESKQSIESLNLQWRNGKPVLRSISLLTLKNPLKWWLVDQDNDYLYIFAADNKINVYAIGVTELVKVSMPPMDVGQAVVYPVLDSSSRFLYASDPKNKRLHLFRYQNDAGPIARDMKKYGSPVAVGAAAAQLITNAEGSHILLLDPDQAKIQVFDHHYQSGLPHIPAKSQLAGMENIRNLVGHPWGRYFLVLQNASIILLELGSFDGHLRKVGQFKTMADKPKQLLVSGQNGRVFVLGDKALYGCPFEYKEAKMGNCDKVNLPFSAEQMFLLTQNP